MLCIAFVSICMQVHAYVYRLLGMLDVSPRHFTRVVSRGVVFRSMSLKPSGRLAGNPSSEFFSDGCHSWKLISFPKAEVFCFCCTFACETRWAVCKQTFSDRVTERTSKRLVNWKRHRRWYRKEKKDSKAVPWDEVSSSKLLKQAVSMRLCRYPHMMMHASWRDHVLNGSACSFYPRPWLFLRSTRCIAGDFKLCQAYPAY